MKSQSLIKALEYIQAGYSLNDARDRLAPSRAYGWFLLLWKWSAFHYGDREQIRMQKRLGAPHLYSRISRCRAFITANTTLNLPPL
jgi:hypothetical protein